MKTNTKGFTLIELLAVIVILAVIALIASPIILGIISNSQESARARSVEAYAHAIEDTVASAMSNPAFAGGDVVIVVKDDNTTVACVGTVDASGVGTCTSGAQEVEVTYSGSKVECPKANVLYNPSTGFLKLSHCKVAGSQDEFYYNNDPKATGTEEAGTTNGSARKHETKKA